MSALSSTPDQQQIVTIDGPAGSGKSTVAVSLALLLNATLINSGSLYRAVTKHYLRISRERNMSPDMEEFATWVEVYMDITIADGAVTETFCTPVAMAELKSHEINQNISEVSAYPPIRAWVNNRLHQYVASLAEATVICEGRDAGHVIFPNAQTKLYLTATAEVRAERIGETAQQVTDRDDADRRKVVGNLLTVEEARSLGYYIFDSSTLSAGEVLELAIDSVNQTFPI